MKKNITSETLEWIEENWEDSTQFLNNKNRNKRKRKLTKKIRRDKENANNKSKER